MKVLQDPALPGRWGGRVQTASGATYHFIFCAGDRLATFCWSLSTSKVAARPMLTQYYDGCGQLRRLGIALYRGTTHVENRLFW